jgi:hypothetical protein
MRKGKFIFSQTQTRKFITCTNSSLTHAPHVLKQSTQVGHLSPFETATCRNLNLPLVTPEGIHPAINIDLPKIDMLKITVTLKNRKTPKMSGMTGRPLPNVVCLKIDTAKNRISSHVMISYSSDSILCEDSKYAIRIDMQGLELHLLKIVSPCMLLEIGSLDLIFCKEPRYMLLTIYFD